MNIEQEIYNRHKTVIDQFELAVSEMITLLTADRKYVVHIPCSMGKDSNTVLTIALEAYNRCILAGLIESERPLIVSNVDPKAEAIPMLMYVHYCVPRLKAYAKKKNINLYFDIVSPAFQDEYANKYLTAQKLIPNASRNGDCSVILKITASEKYVKTILSRFKSSEKMSKYCNAQVISVTGSRIDEGSRRAGNMATQNIKDKSISDLHDELESVDTGSTTLYKFAPIRNWTTEQVFLANELAGEKPLTKNALGIHNAIPSFLSDFALLLAIYGNASSEACEISIGSKATSGCNGKARFGCVVCTMVGTIDKTQTSLAASPRWAALGQEEALRVRDLMFRLSTDMNARALHAKAYDPVGYNRIVLQPNILKPRHLEKLIRLFSQLSVLSQDRAAEFKVLVEQGREDEHAGIQDIKSDLTLTAKARRRFLEMYKEQAQRPLINLFSLKHALYLSYRWCLDGVATHPYRPLAIWNDIANQKGWIPFPLTNEEYQYKYGVKVGISEQDELPEAILMPVYNNEYEKPEVFLNSKFRNLGSLWERPISVIDVTSEDGFNNCSTTLTPENKIPVKGVYSVDLDVNTEKGTPIPITVDGVSELLFVNILAAKLLSASVNSKKCSIGLFSRLSKDEEKFNVVASKIKAMASNVAEQLKKASFSTMDEAEIAVKEIFKELIPSNNMSVTTHLPFLAKETLINAKRTKAKKAAPKINFTKRRYLKISGKIKKGTTRLSFYPLSTESRYTQANLQPIQILTTNPSAQYQSEMCLHEDDLNGSSDLIEKVNIKISDKAVAEWLSSNGLERAIEIHDKCVERTINNSRHNRMQKSTFSVTKSLRQLGDESVMTELMRHGVISVSNKYLPTLMQIKKRTEIFATMGSYDYQSMNYEDLLNLPWAITMKQHRKDKAQVLKVVRKMRNKCRSSTMKLGSVDNKKQAVSSFADEACKNINDYVMLSGSRLFKAAFNTREVSFAMRSNAALAWILNYEKELTDPLALEKLIFPIGTEKDKNPVRFISQVVEPSLLRVCEQGAAVCSHWQPMIDAILAIHTRHKGEYNSLDDENAADRTSLRDSILADYQDAVAEHHPKTDDVWLIHTDSWRPNLNTLMTSLGDMTTTMQGIIDEIAKFIESVKKGLTKGKKKSMQNANLLNQLTLIPQNEIKVIKQREDESQEVNGRWFDLDNEDDCGERIISVSENVVEIKKHQQKKVKKNTGSLLSYLAK
ncbi:hypothetical protein [Photobacterium kishitanii]|uniref:Phosphoadenosine phosphosulphate reductase domain-containing protein n=1 Tax=Photobacterium kishitanii TaxID=318456 RepID=A0A2T3KKX9_9GAMM|nr:hypothetical protein [Photobacterium kishitanii]PSV00375.1 hypothetical protein C9J27_04405 [Photobacterium kishitanii]